jgi:hypothetical protein
MRFQNEKLFTNQQTQKPKRNDRNSLQPNSPPDSQTIKTHNHSPSNTRHNTSPIPNNGSPRRESQSMGFIKLKLHSLSFFLVLRTKFQASSILSTKCSCRYREHYYRHGCMCNREAGVEVIIERCMQSNNMSMVLMILTVWRYALMSHVHYILYY